MGTEFIDDADEVEPLSVGEALEAARSKSVFAGHPASDDDDDKTEGDDDTSGSDDTKQDDDSKQDDDNDQQDTDESPIEAESPKKKFKYASQDEAEKGAKEAERRMHEAIDEVRKMRSEVEEIRKQVTEAAKQGDVTPQEKKELDGLFKSMLSNIKDLDPNDENYDETLAKVWAENIKTAISSVLTEETAKQAETRRQKEAEEANYAMIAKKATSMAKKAGLDMDTEDSADQELFWNLSANAVGDTLEDRIEWTISKVNNMKASIAGKTIESQKKSKDAQAKNKVLERGVSNVNVGRKSDDVKPMSIMEALAKVERRV